MGETYMGGSGKPLLIGLINFVLPQQLGARDMAFPVLNQVSLGLTATGLTPPIPHHRARRGSGLSLSRSSALPFLLSLFSRPFWFSPSDIGAGNGSPGA